jgi:Dyp-type peroxidase family
MLPKIGNGPGIRIHFDYTDGISQPIIEGASRRSSDMQPVVSSHHFFLQEESPSYRIPEPKQLSLYGSFQVLRVLEQDVVGFENFLQSQSHIIDPELLAAKMMGRWRNGVPLILSSDTDTPSPPIPYEEYNNYNYIRTQNNPDDTLGLRCPLGAHMRRSNPRADRVQGGSVEIHRILRRGMPYGPPYDPNKPYDGIERGLLGIFICASIENQFEFLMQDWVNRGGFIANLPATEKDPILGDNTPEESAFTIPNQNGPLKITGFQRFIKARGGAYFFLPSIAGLNYIAGRMST